MRLQPEITQELPPVERRKELRMVFGLTMKELGEKVGVSESAISSYESGRRTPRGQAKARYLKFCRNAEEVLKEQQKDKGNESQEGTE